MINTDNNMYTFFYFLFQVFMTIFIINGYVLEKKVKRYKVEKEILILWIRCTVNTFKILFWFEKI